MGKQCARRVFAVFMVLFLTVGILTFPSAAQEAAYTQLQQRENVTLKRLAGIPAEEALEALVNAGFYYNESFFSDPDYFPDETAFYNLASSIIGDLERGFTLEFSFEETCNDTVMWQNISAFARNLQFFLINHDPQVAKEYLWQDDAEGILSSFSAREFANLTEDECLAHVMKYGLTVPNLNEFFTSYGDEGYLAKRALEFSLNGEFMRNWNYADFGASDLAIRVQLLAMKYDPEIAAIYQRCIDEQKGVSQKSENRMSLPGIMRAGGLQDSTTLGSWDNSYYDINCYGYALGTNTSVNPGYYSGSYPDYYSISSIADAVVADLDSLGYWASRSTTKPSLLTYWQEVLCVRKESSSNQFHFMSGGTSVTRWVHKPGKSIPLVWDYSSPGAKVWTDEAVIDGTYYSPSIEYDSTIYYIIYWRKGGPGPDINSLNPITE